MADTNKLELSIHIAAKPATVYRFLSDPKLFTQWMGTGAVLDADSLRVEYPNGHAAVGTIREAVADRRIVFGWGYENNAHGLAPDSTTVTIELTATPGGGTDVRLTHAGLDAGQQQEHSQGWMYYLSQLASAAAAIGAKEGLPDKVAAYCAAWNETDAAKRRELLASCWEPTAAFRDAMGSADGLDALDQYIANAHKLLPGFRLEAAGPADLVHGYVRFPWVIRLPDGSATMRGSNFGQLSPEGKFQFLTGFGEA